MEEKEGRRQMQGRPMIEGSDILLQVYNHGLQEINHNYIWLLQKNTKFVKC